MRVFVLLISCMALILVTTARAITEVASPNLVPMRKNVEMFRFLSDLMPKRFRRKLQQSEHSIGGGVSDTSHSLRTEGYPKVATSGSGEVRTATGGFIYTLLVTLTVIAFLSNGAFLIYVFWLSK